MYLVAVVAANLAIAHFGPAATPFVAFVAIGLDLSSRDALHEAWHNNGLWWKMFALIGSGSLLSWLLNANAGSIALASFIAFAASGLSDSLMYQLLHKYPSLVKMNGSNLLSAAVDSLVFPNVAFGSFMPMVVLGQFAAKVLGGFVWSLVLRGKITKKVIA
jgi:uncharacterized PurR-regulated membrane protein YhhQ (DUF165 family)